MTPQECSVLLTFAAALDARLQTRDADEAMVQAAAWSDVLRGIPPNFGMAYARRYYKNRQATRLEPSYIRSAWHRTGERWVDPVAPDNERRCRYWRSCSCPHTTCFDGWIGADGPAQRCPLCEEAITMADEMAREQRKARRAASR